MLRNSYIKEFRGGKGGYTEGHGEGHRVARRAFFRGEVIGFRRQDLGVRGQDLGILGGRI